MAIGVSVPRAERIAEGRGRIGLLLEPMAAQGVALAGMVLVFVGLAVDAWRHSSANATEESLLSLSNPGHAIAGLGLVLALAGLLASISLAAARHVKLSSAAVPVFAAVIAAWVATVGAAAGALGYIAASGTTVGHSHDAGAEMASGSALGGHPHQAGEHDHGPHASYTEIMTTADAPLLPRFPTGTIGLDQLPLLRSQLRDASAAADRYPTVAAAEAAGYRLTTTDVDYMGLHYLSIENVTDGVFDPSRPEGLLFSRTDGPDPALVGVWYLQTPGVGNVSRDVAPEGFAGDVDYWHGHQNVCLPFETEGGTEADCVAQGGRFLTDTRWMMHAWVVPSAGDNPDGVFAYLNRDLYAKQLAAHGNDPDSDADGLTDSLELKLVQNPIARDSDGDGIADGIDVDWLRASIADLPEGAFESTDAGERATVVSIVDAVHASFIEGDAAGAVTGLQQVRARLDGCSLDTVESPWMEACRRQTETRDLIDVLIANAGG